MTAPGKDWTGATFGQAVVETRICRRSNGFRSTRSVWAVRCGCGIALERMSSQLQDARRKNALILCPSCLASAARIRASLPRRPRAHLPT